MSALSRKITVATAMGACALTAMTGCSTTDTDSSRLSSPSSPSTPAPETSGSTQYADGRYEANGEYGSQDSSIGVTLTLSDDVITEITVDPHATDPTSLDLQERFAEAIPDRVVGRGIDDVHIDRLAGSSHTPDGFNDALEKIKNEAGK
ncbi:FMN-binding protein [Streptomyces anulatus]|uniref:FMN-binding protein n=1 Tax=Streptomyces anulatus TaxID=1892 RepID=UPI0034274BC0